MVEISNNKYFINDDFNKQMFVIFVDPESGSKRGRMLLEMEIKQMKFEEPALVSFIYNLRDGKKLTEGINVIKEYMSNSTNKVRVIICGGDDIVMSIIEKLFSMRVDLSKCVFGTLPVGNDNNISNTLNFNDRKNANPNIMNFKKLLMSYSKAKEVDVDIWKIEFILERDGGIFQNKGDKKIELVDENSDNVLFMEKAFIGSFSLGVDARVGFNFDKQRSSSYYFNKAIYFWESVKKMFCVRTMSLNSYIDSFYSEEKEVFRGKEEKDQVSKSLKYNYFKEKVVLKGDPLILIGQNVNYYNGSSNFWSNAGTRLGLEFDDEGTPTKIEKKSKLTEEALHFKELCANNKQEFNDGKMEFYTLSGVFGLGLEKVLGGYAKKVHQSSGPFVIHFRKVAANVVADKEHRIYAKIDGEHYHIVRPREMKISLHNNYPKGSVKFLVNK